MAHLVLDLRWVRSQTLDGIARVSLSYAAELLRTSTHEYTLLFQNKALKDFCLRWIDAYSPQPVCSNFRIIVCGYDARSFKNRLLLRPQLRSLRPDVYFSFYYIFHRMPGINLAMVHDLTPLHYPAYFKQASALFRLLLCSPKGLTWLLKQADFLITVSQNTYQDIVALLPAYRDKTFVNPLAAAPAQAIALEACEGLKHITPPFILQVGRADPHKNQQGLLSAYALLDTTLQSQYALVFAGPTDARYTPRLLALASTRQISERIHFTGPLTPTELNALYQAATVMVMPSYYEGFGLPVLEAMSNGTPTLLSDRSSLPEVGGDAACYSPPDHPEALAKSLSQLLNSGSEQERLSTLGRQRAAEFSWSLTRTRFLNILEQILPL
jgi:glycosyltransferase involved in cell wall biosynthesis